MIVENNDINRRVFADPIRITPNGLIEAIDISNLGESVLIVEQEIAQWRDFFKLSASFDAFCDKINQAKVELENIKVVIQSYQKNSVTHFSNNELDSIKSTLLKLENSPFIYSKSYPGEKILSLFKKGDHITSVYCYNSYIMHSVPITYDNRIYDASSVIHMGVMGVLTNKKINALSRLEEQGLLVARQSMERKIKDVRSQVGGLFNNMDSLQNEMKDNISTLRSEFKNISEEAENIMIRVDSACQSKLSHTENELEKIRKIFTDDIKLKSTAEYWIAKAAEHKESRLSALRMIASLSIFGFLLFGAMLFAIDKINQLISQNQGIVVFLLMLSIPIFVFATILRIFVREHRDQGRLVDDAKQRSALLKTYLALIKEEGSTINQGERILALHALFRGTVLFESNDDTPPINALEVLINMLGKQGK
jgi:hypothetical protein